MAHKNLASERHRIGMSQTELAEELHVSLSSIGKWEKDISTMPMEVVKKAASFFGCSVDYLADRTEERLPRVS